MCWPWIKRHREKSTLRFAGQASTCFLKGYLKQHVPSIFLLSHQKLPWKGTAIPKMRRACVECLRGL